MKKRKFRAMTIGEHCYDTKIGACINCEYRQPPFYCEYFTLNRVDKLKNKTKPYKTKDGKYILIEVKDNDRK